MFHLKLPSDPLRCVWAAFQAAWRKQNERVREEKRRKLFPRLRLMLFQITKALDEAFPSTILDAFPTFELFIQPASTTEFVGRIILVDI